MKNLIKKYLNVEKAHAHCDIPCGIYDPITAQIDAITVVRMIDLIAELDGKMDAESKNKFARCVKIKEDHAESAKHQIRIIWGDFIKPAHIEKYPKIHELVHTIMMKASNCRTTVNRENAVGLLDSINEFAEIFWQIKGEETIRAKAPYAPNLDFVYRKIDA